MWLALTVTRHLWKPIGPCGKQCSLPRQCCSLWGGTDASFTIGTAPAQLPQCLWACLWALLVCVCVSIFTVSTRKYTPTYSQRRPGCELWNVLKFRDSFRSLTVSSGVSAAVPSPSVNPHTIINTLYQTCWCIGLSSKLLGQTVVLGTLTL